MVQLGKIKCLTILARYEAKIAKICNFWTFRLVIQLRKQLFKIRHLWSIGQKGFLSDFEKIVY